MKDKQKLKVCLIFNGAPDYRRAIYLLIEDKYDCSWYFIKKKRDAYGKEMDLKLLKDVHFIDEVSVLGSPLSYQKGLVKLLFNSKYNVYFVVGSLWSIGLWIFCVLKKLFFPNKRVYFWSHGILRVRRWPINIISRLFFKLPDGIFTYGDRARSIMIKEGLNGNKIWSIHNSLDYETQIKYRNNFSNIYEKHFGNSLPVVFFIGRLTPVKRLDLLVNAFYQMLKEGVDANLVLIGEGPVKEYLQNLVNDMALEEKVWFYGKCFNEDEKSKLIVNADLCVAPGNIGLTAMDALVYGTPCLTMNNFNMQMPEHEAIIDGVTGCFFKENDVRDLAFKMKTWLQSNVSRETVRKNCYDIIDRCWNPEFQIKLIKENLL